MVCVTTHSYPGFQAACSPDEAQRNPGGTPNRRTIALLSANDFDFKKRRNTMPQGIPESDWKLFRKLHPVLVERFCKQILSELDAVSADEAKTFHQRYSDIYKLIERRDNELAYLFDNPRRSSAMGQIVAIYQHGLLTEDELNGFGQTLVKLVKFLTDKDLV